MSRTSFVLWMGLIAWLCWVVVAFYVGAQHRTENLFHHADYTPPRCRVLPEDPITRPDGYTAHPYGRKSDTA